MGSHGANWPDRNRLNPARRSMPDCCKRCIRKYAPNDANDGSLASRFLFAENYACARG